MNLAILLMMLYASDGSQGIDHYMKRCDPRFRKKIVRTITKQAQKHLLSPKLLAAIIVKESSCRSHVVSRKGAVGLMQVMPRTAKRPVAELKDPLTNIEVGTKILKDYIEAGGNLRRGLSIYNTGRVNGVGLRYADRILSEVNRM